MPRLTPSIATRVSSAILWSLGLLCLAAPAAFCQAAPQGHQSLPPVRELVKSETVQFVAPPPILVDFPIKCDRDGNIFVAYTANPYAGSGASGGASRPITEVVLESKSTVQFRMSPIDGYDTQNRRYFGLDQRGTLYALLSANPANGKENRQKQPDYFIEKFKEDGTRDSLTKLLLPAGARMWPMLFGVFNDGSYLATGTNLSLTSTAGAISGPFTAIFDSSGRFVQSVRLPDDVPDSPATRVPPRHPQVDPRKQATDNTPSVLSVLEGGLVSAADGNVYLVRAGNPMRIYGISPGGEVVTQAQAPIPEPGLSLVEVGASAAGLYFHFGHVATSVSPDGSDPRNVVALFDLNIKRFVALYRLPANVSQDWVPACADNRGNFSFLGETADGRLQVTTYMEH